MMPHILTVFVLLNLIQQKTEGLILTFSKLQRVAFQKRPGSWLQSKGFEYRNHCILGLTYFSMQKANKKWLSSLVLYPPFTSLTSFSLLLPFPLLHPPFPQCCVPPKTHQLNSFLLSQHKETSLHGSTNLSDISASFDLTLIPSLFLSLCKTFSPDQSNIAGET